MSLILDAGAISAVAEGDARARAFLQVMRSGGHRVFTPSVVVAEVTGRGARDAPTNRVLAGVEVIGVDEQLARAGGVLRFRSGVSGTIDALVVATAEAAGSGVVLTGDVDDLARLASATVSVEVRGW